MAKCRRNQGWWQATAGQGWPSVAGTKDGGRRPPAKDGQVSPEPRMVAGDRSSVPVGNVLVSNSSPLPAFREVWLATRLSRSLL